MVFCRGKDHGLYLFIGCPLYFKQPVALNIIMYSFMQVVISVGGQTMGDH